MIHCPFCGWYRTRDTRKGAPPWDRTAAIRELQDHLHELHELEWQEFLMNVEGYDEQEA